MKKLSIQKIMLLAMSIVLSVPAQAIPALARGAARIGAQVARVGAPSRQIAAKVISRPIVSPLISPSTRSFTSASKKALPSDSSSRFARNAAALIAGGLAGGIGFDQAMAEQKSAIPQNWGKHWGDLTPADREYLQGRLLSDVRDLEQKLEAELASAKLTNVEWEVLKKQIERVLSNELNDQGLHEHFFKVLTAAQQDQFWTSRKKVISLRGNIEKKKLDEQLKWDGIKWAAAVVIACCGVLAIQHYVELSQEAAQSERLRQIGLELGQRNAIIVGIAQEANVRHHIAETVAVRAIELNERLIADNERLGADNERLGADNERLGAGARGAYVMLAQTLATLEVVLAAASGREVPNAVNWDSLGAGTPLGTLASET